MTSVGTIHAYPNNQGLNRAKVAAAFGGVTVDFQAVKMGVDNKTPEFLSWNPFGQVPTMVTSEGAIFESNAIVRYVARKGNNKSILGNNDFEASQVDQWIEVFRSQEGPIFHYTAQVMGFRPYDEKMWNAGKEALNKFLGVLNTFLEGKEYFVGNHITIVDICYACTFAFVFGLVCDSEMKAQYKNVITWLERCLALPQFKEVMGDPKYAAAAPQPKQQ